MLWGYSYVGMPGCKRCHLVANAQVGSQLIDGLVLAPAIVKHEWAYALNCIVTGTLGCCRSRGRLGAHNVLSTSKHTACRDHVTLVP